MKLRKPVVVDLMDCQFSAVRGSGPGGQAVAKTSNMAILLHKPSGITIKVSQRFIFAINFFKESRNKIVGAE